MSRGTLWRARWVLPVASPPIRDGAVHVADGRIVAVGPAAGVAHEASGADVRDLGDAILCPGLVNAHTHLSLTGVADRLPRQGPLLEWLAQITRAAASLTDNEVRQAVRQGLTASRALGTVAVGDITTRIEGVVELERDRQMCARVYFEFLGVSAERAGRRFEAAAAAARSLHERAGTAGLVRAGLSPHAPYSVWPTLWRECATLCRENGWRWSSHVAESPFEREFLQAGRGPLRDHLVRLGVWDEAYPVPGVGIGTLWAKDHVLDGAALLVHGIHLEPADLDAVAAAGARLCLCPRSNAVLDLPPPPVLEFLRRGIVLCLGTDSLASNRDLGVWGEMRAIRALAPELPAAAILRMATLDGARALGLEDLCGAIRPGLPARLLAVLAPGVGAADPTEYLVREALESQVHPLDDVREVAG